MGIAGAAETMRQVEPMTPCASAMQQASGALRAQGCRPMQVRPRRCRRSTQPAQRRLAVGETLVEVTARGSLQFDRARLAVFGLRQVGDARAAERGVVVGEVLRVPLFTIALRLAKVDTPTLEGYL